MVRSILGDSVCNIAAYLLKINLVLIEESCSWIGKDVMKKNSQVKELKSKSLNFAMIVECETESNHISDSGDDISF